MWDERKTKKELIDEIARLRRKIESLEASSSPDSSDSEQQWESMFDAIGDAVAIVNLKGEFIRCNKATATFLKRPSEEIIGRTCFELIHSATGAVDVCPSVRMGKSGKRESLVVMRDEKWIQIDADPLRRDNGDLVGAVYIITDITDRKNAERMLRDYARQRVIFEEDLRRRFSRELHDRVGRDLSALGIGLHIALSGLPQEYMADIGKKLEDASVLVEEITRNVRNMMAELRPPVLDDYGLVSAIRWYADVFSERTGIPVEVCAEELGGSLSDEDEINVFRIAQEAMTNVAKYARAGHVRIVLAREKDGVFLSIADDGIGFDQGEYRCREKVSGWGLITMKERSEAMGGTFDIESSPVRGTVINVRVPG